MSPEPFSLFHHCAFFDYVVSLWWYIAIVRNPSCELNILCASQQQNIGRRFGASKMHFWPPVALTAVRLRRWFCCCLFAVNVTPIVGFCNCSMYCCELLCIRSKICNHLDGEERAGCWLSSWCLVIVVWHYLKMPRVCLQFVIVVYPDHTHHFWLCFNDCII